MTLWRIYHLNGGVEVVAALSEWEFVARRYLPVILLSGLLVALLIKAYRLWQEIHDVEEPVLTGDLLEAFEQAHADGDLDDEEFERIRRQLKSNPGGVDMTFLQRSKSSAPSPRKPRPSQGELRSEPDRSFYDPSP